MSKSLIIDYVTEEVSRQGHDVTKLDGIERVKFMLDGWVYALVHGTLPTVDDAIILGRLIEPKMNAMGTRSCHVMVGGHVPPNPRKVPALLVGLFESMDKYTPLEFYKEFELIHPFADGNGRTGKIIMNWIAGTLLDPIFPPSNLWGREISNP